MLFDPDRVLIESDRYAACKARDISNLCREGHFQVIPSQMFALFLLYLLLLEHALHCCLLLIAVHVSTCLPYANVYYNVLHVICNVMHTLGFAVDIWQLGGPKCGTRQCSGSPRAPERQVCVQHIYALWQNRILYCHYSHDHHEYDPTIYLIARFCCTHLEHFCNNLLLHLSDMISRVGVTSSSHQPHLKLIKHWR